LILARLVHVDLHPIIEACSSGIFRDHRVPMGSRTPAKLISLLMEFVGMGHSAKVELRRWWTYFASGRYLDVVWHSMLCALMLDKALHGEDPFSVLPSPMLAADDEERKEFHYKEL
jgi:hypothetical protein